MVSQGYIVKGVFYSYGSHKLPWKINKLKRNIEDQKHEIIKYIEKEDFDLMFVIKGEIIQKNILDYFRKKNPKAITINYQWDSVANFPGGIELINAYDYKYTFDHLDCIKYKKYKLIHRPLFYSNEYNGSECEYVFDMASIGGMQKKRVEIISMIDKLFPEYKKKILLRTAITLNLPFNLKKYGAITYIRYALFNDLNRNSVAEILKKTKVIIDVPQENQAGLTMRTIEVLGLGKKTITTNNYIDKYDFYDRNNIMILNNFNKWEISKFIEMPKISINNEIKIKYTLKYWVYYIINTMSDDVYIKLNV